MLHLKMQLIRQSNVHKNIYSLLTTLILIGLLGGCDKSIDPITYKSAFFKGNQIIAALDKYYKKNGFYPEKLNLLIPEYMESIPLPGVGKQKFFYLKDDREGENSIGYLLSFIVKPKGVLLLGAKAIQSFDYNPVGKYKSSGNVTVHYIYKNWALQTKRR